ncbi:type VI secretion system TssO [Chryseobacterium sp. TY3]
MISYGQKTLNQNDVRNATVKFMLTFILLAGLGFLSVFLFFKSSKMQAENIREELADYQDLLSRNNLLKIKMDTIYTKMSALSQNKVDNDMALRNSIFDDMQVSKKIVGKDSADNFKHYMVLMKNIKPMLTLKNDLLVKKSEEANIDRDLQQCINSSTKVQQKIIEQVAPKTENRGRLFQNYKK